MSMMTSLAATDAADAPTGALLALALIILAAVICGKIAQRVGQPKVLGEMIAGIVLGPSALGAIAPDVQEDIFSPSVLPILSGISAVGLTLYMFLVGVRFNHQAVGESRACPAATIAAGSAIPVLLGAGTALLIAQSHKPDGVSLVQYCLFVGGALSVTAFPMLASILEERGMSGTRFGSLATATAAGDDAIAWCLLAVVLSMSTGSYLDGLQTIALAGVFAGMCALLIPRLFRDPIARNAESGQLSNGVLGGLVITALLAGWVTDRIGVYAVFGGFVAGAFVPYDARFAEIVRTRLMKVVGVVFLPVFFTLSGLRTDLGAVISFDAMALLGAFIAVGFIVKLGSLFAVMRMFKWGTGPALAMGGLMNARGLMILIFIGVGLEVGIIDDTMFSVFVVVAVTTTALAVPIYRIHFSDREEEAERDRSSKFAARDVSST